MRFSAPGNSALDGTRLLAMLIAFLSMAVIFLFKTYADSRFLALTGSHYLPHLLAAQALLMMLLSALYAYLVKRLSALRLDLLLIGGTVLSGLAAPLLFAQGTAAVFAGTLLLLSFPAIANLAIWNSAQGVVSGRAIRRFLPQLGAVATGGAAVGSLAATQLSIELGVDSLAPTATVPALLLVGLRVTLENHHPHCSPTLPTDLPGSQSSPLLVKDSRRLLALLVFGTLLETLIAGLVDYSFKRELTLTLDNDQLAVFLSLFYAAANATMLMVQWFGASRLFSLHPLRRTATLTPIAMTLMGLLWLLFPGLWVLVATRFTDAVMRFAVARPSLEISLAPLEGVTRRRWQVLLRGGFAQIGTVLAGALLILMSDYLGTAPSAIAGLLLPASFGWLLVQQRSAAAYAQLLAHVIGRKQLSSLHHPASHRPDRDTIAQLLALLDDPSPETRDFTRQFLAGLELDPGDLIPHLDTPGRSVQVRKTLFQLIATQAHPRWGSTLAAVVAREPTSTPAYIAALDALGGCRHRGECRRAQGLIGDRTPAQMSDLSLACALYLARVGQLKTTHWDLQALINRLLQHHGRDAGLAIQGLIANGAIDADDADRLLAAAPPQSCSATLQAYALSATPRSLAMLADAIGDGRKEVDLALPLLSDKALWRLVRRISADNPGTETRRRLVYALRFHHGPQSVRETARFLDDPNAATRRAAVRSLLRKRQQQLGPLPRGRYHHALDRQLRYFETLVHTRVPPSQRPADSLFDVELEQRTDQALDELSGLLALSGDPASIVSARRSLRSPDPAQRRQSLDALQEVMRGRRQRQLIQLVEIYLAPGPPQPSTPETPERRLAAPDPWLARCLDGSLSDVAEHIIALRDTTLFRDLDGERLEDLVRDSRCHWFPAGETIIRRGDPGDQLFVTLEGEVEFITDGQAIARLGYPTVFGELSVLDGGLRSATVVSRTTTQLLCIQRDRFIGLIETYPEVGVGLLGVLASWLRPLSGTAQ